MSLSIERKELRNKKLETLSKVSAQRRYLLEILNNIEKEEEMNKIHVDEGEIIIKTLDESKVKDKIRKTIHIIDSYVPDFQKFLNEEYLPQKEKAKFALYNKIKTRFKWGWKKGKGYGLETISNTISEVIKDVKLAQNADYQLQLLQDNDVKFFSNNGGESTVEKKEQLETTLTLDYQKKKRGASRIILDGIQNHLPGDSKGEHAYIHFFDEDQQQRISLKEAQQTSNRLSKIRFVDDGIGYDLKNLLFFFSTKENDKDAVGQFGEGIKMIATASLREGVEIEFESQNRRAKPTTKEVLLESNKSTRTMQQLCYDVEYLKRERPFIGSKTTFHNPSRELINLAKGVWDTILHFKPDYEPIDTARDGEVVSLDNRRLYLKGLYINDADNSTYFSYNFYEGEPNRDRDTLKPEEYKWKIKNIISATTSKAIIKRLMELEENKDYSFNSETSWVLNISYPKLWKECFLEKYWEKATILKKEKITEKMRRTLKENGYSIVSFPDGLLWTLSKAGVPSAIDFYDETAQYELETSFTLDYMKDQRGVERIVLDTIQNHLPGDCGGTQVDIIIETRRGNRIPLEDALGLSSKEIKNIIFKDNGRGYDANYLGILKTGKENNKQAAGQFGEGLKMIASASLREGLDIGYKSRNWEAQADKRQIKIEGEDAEKLYFKVKEGDRSITGSQTHFSNITDSFWEEVRDIYDKVLFLRKNLQPLSQESDGSQVLDDHMGRIFVKGILLTDAYKDQLLFSYNLATDHINRDRNFVDNEQVQKDVKRLISNTSNKNLIAMILEKSHSKPTFMSEKSVFDKKEKKNFLEFQEMDVKYANIWREVFYKNYGGKAILDDGNNDQQKYDAEKLGYEPITLEYNIMKTLKKSWVNSTLQVIRGHEERFDWIENKRLPKKQQEILNTHKIIDPYLENNKESSIVVFNSSSKDTKEDKVLSFHNRSQNYIAIRQELLNDPEEFAKAYISEKALMITGALIGSRSHINYLSKNLITFILLAEEQKNKKVIEEKPEKKHSIEDELSF